MVKLAHSLMHLPLMDFYTMHKLAKCLNFTFTFGFMSTVYVHVVTQMGRTPVMAASFHGHVDIMRMLIKAKAQINTKDKVCCLLQKIIYNTLHHYFPL